MKRIWVDRDKCLGCKSCELACAVERDSVAKNLMDAAKERPLPTARVGVFGPTDGCFPVQCRHCQDAPCLKACPSGALQRDAETEVVLVDQNKCRGCWMCVMTCPFGSIIPSATYKVAMKCDACLHREEPACVAACPTGALLFGEEECYGQVLAAKRGRVVAFARSVNTPGAAPVISLDFVRGGE